MIRNRKANKISVVEYKNKNLDQAYFYLKSQKIFLK
jgi:hypothetical protein